MIADSKVTDKPERIIEYPLLMIGKNTGTVILFTESKIGTVLSSGDSATDPMGKYATTWCMDNFKVFNGNVELFNK